MNENRFFLRWGGGAGSSPLLAFVGALDTIEGMSLGRRCVNCASVLSALLVTVAAEAHRNLPGDLPARSWASSVLAELPDGYIVAPFENASPLKQLDWMSSA